MSKKELTREEGIAKMWQVLRELDNYRDCQALAGQRCDADDWKMYQKTIDCLDDTYNELYLKYYKGCLLYTSPSPRDRQKSRMPSSA